jgi:uncharacterized protein
MTLQDFFTANPKTAIAFSGGVDSAVLLAIALRFGADVKPYFIKTPFQPQFELEDAIKTAQLLGISVTILETDVLCHAEVAANGPDRCYHCKRALFSLLTKQAAADGYDVVLDGTNASDDLSDRPGVKALQELGVLSPLRLCGVTKAEIRQLAKEAGLPVWDKPAYACLATRTPTGTAIHRETLQKVEAAEAELMAMGYRDFRVRVFHGGARLQLPREQFPTTPEQYDRLRAALADRFDPIFLDLKGR